MRPQQMNATLRRLEAVVPPRIVATKELTWAVSGKPWEVVVEIRDPSGRFAFCACDHVATAQEAEAAIASLKAEARSYMSQKRRAV